MTALPRLHREQDFHDRQARQRAVTFSSHPDALVFDDDDYLAHETWIGPAFAALGDLRGARALDFGCGHGMAAVVLARLGARVTAFDLAPGYLTEAQKRAVANGAAIDFLQADAERLPFADQTFDRIWGNAILHHLDLPRSAGEVRRILRPGGLAVFCEPWGGNPVLNWARQRLPYAGKNRTPDEEPLRPRHLRQLRAVFPQLEVRGFQLVSMARRVVRLRPVVAGMEWCDAQLLPRFPALQRFCRYVVLILRS